MPKFNPLRFSIEIVDNIDSQLKGIQTKIENAFRSMPIGFTLDQGSVEQLRRQLQSVTQGLDLSKLQMPDMSKVIEQSVNAAVSKLNNIKDSNVNVNISDGSMKQIDAIIEKLNSIKECGITLKINNLAEINRILSEINAPVLTLSPPNQKHVEAQLQAYMEKLTALQGTMSKPADSNIGKQAWNDVDALKALVEQADKATASIKALADKNSVQNSGKSSTLFKQFTDLGKGLTDAIGQTPKVEESSLNAFISIIKQKFDEIQAEVDRRGKGLSSTFSAQFNTIRQNLSNLTAVGVGNEAVNKMQQEMAGVASAFNSHITSMQAMLSSLKEALSNDNFTAFTNRIEKCAEAMEKLTAAFEKFNGVIGSNKSMAEFMTGLGEVVRNVRFKLQQLGEGVNNMSLDQGSANYTRNTTIMVEALNQLQDAQLRVTSAMDKARQAGAPTDEYERYLKLLRNYMREVQAQKDDVATMGISGSASLFLGKSVKHFNDNSRALEQMAKSYTDASLKISAATVDIDSSINRLTNLMTRTTQAGLPVTDLKNAAQKLEDWKNKMASTSDIMGKAGIAGQAQQDIENAKVLVRLQEERNKNQGIYNTLIAEGTRRINSALTLSAEGKGLKLDTTQLDEAIQRTENAIKRMNNEGLVNLDSVQLIRELGTEYRRAAYELRNLTREQERANNKQTSTNESEAKKWAESARQATVEQDALNRKLVEYESLIKRASDMGLDTTNLQNSVAVIQDKISKLEQLKSGTGLVVNGKTLTTSDYLKMPDYIAAARDANKYAKALNGAVNAMKSGKTEEQLWAESQKDAATKLSTLIPLMERMKALSAVASSKPFNFDTTDLDKAISKIQTWMDKLKKLSEGDKTMGYTKDLLRNPAFATDMAGLQNAANPIRQEIAAIRESERAKRAAGKAAKEMTIEEQKLAQVMEQVTQSAKGQSQVLSDLKSMAAQYFSVYAVQQFLGKIIEVGGQLENQRLSIAAILGDVSHANTLFEQIQSLAVKSPFGVVELDQYTKQLSAFGFKYNELYDMTKRLADISAGAGTDVGRLALALGHVRSEGALTGYTLRQFAMNNIPMLKELSTMLSAREGRVVSTADIRKRVSKKMIDYADVETVIKNLTNEGGMFYNMQEVISGSVKSKWKNLRDALDIMYGRMAESGVGDALKDTATTLTNLTKHWQEIIAVLGVGVTTWGISRMAVNLYNVALGKNATAVFKSMAMARRQEILNQEVAATYRKVSAAEKANVATKNAQVVTTAKLALNTGKLSAEELARSVALGIMSKEEARAAIKASELNGAMRSQAYTMINNTKVLGRAGRAVVTLSMGLNKFWMGMTALLSNPMTWIMVAVTAITELWAKNRAEIGRMNEAIDAIRTKGSEGIRNTQNFLGENGLSLTDAAGRDITNSMEKEIYLQNVRVKYPVFAELDKGSIKAVMENAEQYIREYSYLPSQMMNEAFALRADGEIPTLQQQYESLMKSVQETARAQVFLKNVMAEASRYALDKTNGWLDEDLITNINDYAKAAKKYDDALTDAFKANEKVGNAALDAAMSEQAFADAIQRINTERERSGKSPMTDIEKIKYLTENYDLYSTAYAKFQKASNVNYVLDIAKYYGNNAQSAYKTMEKDLDTYVENVKTKIKEAGYDINNLPSWAKQAIGLAFSEILAKAGETTEKINKELNTLMSQKFGITLDVEELEAVGKISEIKRELEDITSKRWVVEVGVRSDNMGEIVSSVDKKWQEAQTAIKRAFNKDGKNLSLLRELGIKEGEIVPEFLYANMNPAQKQYLDEYNDYVRFVNESKGFYKSLGIEPPEDKNNGRNNYKGELEKRWDERIRIMKEAYDWYDKWNKEYGKDTALEQVGKRYDDIFEVWRSDPNPQLRFDFDANKVEDYLSYVKQIRKEAMALYQQQRNDKDKNNGQEALRVVRQATSVLTDFNWDNMQRASEMALSKMTRSISDLTDKWKIFNDVLDATGSKALAEQLSGVNYSLTATRKDELRDRIKAINGDIDLGRAYGMSEEELKRYINEELMPLPEAGESETDYARRLADYNEQIKATIELIKEWQKASKELSMQDMSTYAKLIGSAQDFNTLRMKNNKEYGDREQALDRLLKNGDITQQQYDASITMATSDRDYKNGKLSSLYDSLMERSATLTKQTFNTAVTQQVENLKKALDSNVISLKQYNEEMAKLRGLERDFNNNSFLGSNVLGAYVKGGLSQVVKYYDDAADTRIGQLMDSGMTREQAERDNDVNKLRSHADAVQKSINELNEFSLGLSVITGMLDGISQAFDSMGQMFDALGNEGAANWFSDASDAVKGVSSVFSPINDIVKSAMNGDVGGLVSGVISAPFKMVTSPITAFSQLHDKKIERQIEKLREEVTKIQNNTALIKDLRERTFGYDNGDLRRSYVAMYSNLWPGSQNSIQKAIHGDKTAYRDMLEYYSRGGTEGTGYQQEYNNLLQERDNLYTQLNKQESKKKKSQADIEETKKQIAELDDQIYNFTQDLAKELWDIDIKSWAQQLSDALCNAFENGEDAAKAYNDTVQDIVRQMMSKMMTMAVIEPMLKKLQDQLFGELQADGTYKGGVVDLNNPEQSAQKVSDIIGEYFGTDGEGRKAITAAQEFLVAYEKALNDVGLTSKNSDTTTLGNGIQGASEETSNLLAGYVNALRQDVAIDRMMLEQFMGEYWESYIGQITAMQTSLSNIDRNVAAIYALMNEQGAMYGLIESIDSRIRRLANGQDKITVA